MIQELGNVADTKVRRRVIEWVSFAPQACRPAVGPIPPAPAFAAIAAVRDFAATILATVFIAVDAYSLAHRAVVPVLASDGKFCLV
jgi:hypothetical protein